MTPMRADIDTFNAADLMTPNVLWAHQDMAVSELADFLAENEISGVPVLGENDEPVGVVSATDIAGTGRPDGDFVVDQSDPNFSVRSFQDKFDVEDLRDMHIEGDSRTVRDIMTPTIFTVPATTPVSEIAREMVAGHVHRLFVTRRGRIVGIISALDLVKLLIGD
jgi:CBS domain-containing protein